MPSLPYCNRKKATEQPFCCVPLSAAAAAVTMVKSPKSLCSIFSVFSLFHPYLPSAFLPFLLTLIWDSGPKFDTSSSLGSSSGGGTFGISA